MSEAPGTRAKRRAETTERIVQTALRVVTEEGFDALTMKRLADELGYAAGALYRYYPSKDELLLAVQRRVLEALAADLGEAERGARAAITRGRSVPAPVAALTPLLAAVRAFVTLPERRPAHWLLLARWMGDPEPLVATEVAAPVLASLLALFAQVPVLFEEAVAGGALAAGDGARRVLALQAALHGALALRKLDRFGLDALRQEPLIDELCRALFVGWGATDETFADAWRRAKKLA
ncbi:MAG: helix-turn-helix transcriptional regulator [Sandaracinaceae bacterium]|nr:helix-turn-helix transcriptional regulator [Sandaracinaceae bacterium]